MKMKRLGIELIPTAFVLSLCAFATAQGLPKAAEGDYVAQNLLADLLEQTKH